MATTPYPFVSGAVLTASQLNSTFNVPINAQTADYVLLAGDAGKRVQMNSATAKTITVNTGVFQAGDNLFIQNIGAGTCTITAGTATVTTAGSLALAQWGGGTLYFTSASAAIFFSGGGANYGAATGGSSSSITVGGINYTLLTFSSDDNLVISRSGIFDILAIGGGGGGTGGDAGTRTGGGGGGGDIVGIDYTLTVYLEAGTYAVDVGAGGAGSTFGQAFGAKSTIDTSRIVAIGGGGGAGYSSTANSSLRVTYQSGASGGGTSFSDSTTGSVNRFLTQGWKGNRGGYVNVALSTGANCSGGGGGAGGVGGDGSGTTGGAGGNGFDISAWITGATYYASAGGGGGATGTGGAAGNGGVAGKTSGTGNNGVNYGAGGGGTNGATGGNGAPGAVFVRFKS